MSAAARDDLLSMSRRDLAEVMRRGHAIEARSLDDTEYHGISLGLPAWMERLSWKTFQKTFHRDRATGELRGWNVRVQQRGIGAASVPIEREGAPVCFGHYRVVDLPAGGAPRGIERGLLIDYAPAGGAMSRVRDPIVAVVAASAELLLGWSYVDLGFARAGTPSYFALVRERPLTHVAAPPAGSSER